MKEQKIRSFALGLVGGLILATALVLLVQVQLTGAQSKPDAKLMGPQKWEYCAIWSTGIEAKQYPGKLSVAYICYFSNEGCQGERVEVDGTNVDVALIRAGAKLGSQGWELVGSAPRRYDDFGTQTTPTGSTTNNPFILYFKRPKT